MIYSETVLSVSDNSGAKNVKCIRVIKSENNPVGSLGSLLLVRVTKKNHSKKIKKKLLYFGLVILLKRYVSRLDGSKVKCSKNKILLFSRTHKFLGTRIYSAVMRDVRLHVHKFKKEKQKYLKVISYAPAII